MSWSLLLLSVLAADAVDAALQPLAGAPISGKLIAIADEKVTVEKDGKATSLGFRDVSEVRLRDPHRSESEPKIIAELRDGSKLNLASYTVAKGVATLGLMGGEQVIEIPARHVKHVQLQSGGPAANLQNEWREIKSKTHSGDVVVLKKKDNVLDYAEGVLYDVTPQQVQFEYDGRLVEVAASKVWGLIYYHPGNAEYPKPACRVVDLYETSWNVRELTQGDGMLHAQLVSGVKVDFPLQTISRIDFSSGNLVYLSELEIQSYEWQPFYRTGDLSEQLTRLFAPSRDAFRDGGKLRLGGVAHDRGVSLHSKTTIRYLLPADVTQFLALAGIDDRADGNGSVLLTVLGDGKQLFRETVSGDRSPTEIKLDVSGVRRMTIVVDFGDDLDIADYLDLCNARFLR